jgi:Peptidase M15
MEDDSGIVPPTSPLTVKLNQGVLDFVFWQWAKRYFPDYSITLTSAYRTPEKNASVAGAANSAHLHGLAYDFVFALNGKAVTLDQARDIYDTVIKPSWPGFSLFEVATKPDGKKVWHVHVNLNRNITTYMGAAGIAILGVLSFQVLKSMGVLK